MVWLLAAKPKTARQRMDTLSHRCGNIIKAAIRRSGATQAATIGDNRGIAGEGKRASGQAGERASHGALKNSRERRIIQIGLTFRRRGDERKRAMPKLRVADWFGGSEPKS
jgi:hypothetical protein